MAEWVAILEDDPNRIVEMRRCLVEILPEAESVFFQDARQMIDWLGLHLGNVILISLDHDLPLRDDDGRSIDCGTGRQVADYLAALPPTCPVIVHSSNQNCAPGMFFALKNGGWPVSQVFPHDEQKWIASAWSERVRQYVREGWISGAGQ